MNPAAIHPTVKTVSFLAKRSLSVCIGKEREEVSYVVFCERFERLPGMDGKAEDGVGVVDD